MQDLGLRRCRVCQRLERAGFLLLALALAIDKQGELLSLVVAACSHALLHLGLMLHAHVEEQLRLAVGQVRVRRALERGLGGAVPRHEVDGRPPVPECTRNGTVAGQP